MSGVGARMDGEVFDPGFWAIANATGLVGVGQMGAAGYLANQGLRVSSALVQTPPDITTVYDNLNRNADENANGGSGYCPPEPNPDEPPPPPPPPPGDPSLPGRGPSYPPDGGSGSPEGEPPNPRRTQGGPPPSGAPRPIDPLVLDLDGDGVELTSLAAGQAYFDFDSDGFAEKTGWVAPDDGLLVLDRNGNGAIDDGSELFGNATVDGFDALKELDSNADGRFDSQDARFGEARVWRDLNGDGISQSGELSALVDVGIASIDLTPRLVGETREGNWVARADDVTFADGRFGTAESVYFSVDRQATKYIVPEDFAYGEFAEILPQLRGYGQVRDLSIAISEDPALMQMLKDFVLDSNGMSVEAFGARAESLIHEWADVDTYQHADRGTHVNYTKLALLESFWGEPFAQQNISLQNARMIDQLYADMIDGLVGRLVVQVGFSYFGLKELEAAGAGVFEHSLSAYGVFFYDRESDIVSGRADFFLGLGTTLLKGTHEEQIHSFENLLDFSPFVSRALFGGEPTFLDRYLAGLVGDETNESSLSHAEIFYAIRNDAVVATDADDSITAAGTATKGAAVYGLGGNDALHGGSLSDGLIGGTGSDALSGNGGDDIYVFNPGDGQDVISEHSGSGSSGGNDTLFVGKGIAAADVVVTQTDDGTNLVLTISGTTDSVKIMNTMVSGNHRVEQVHFADGTVWSHAQIVARSVAFNTGSDSFWGSYDGETIDGGAGNDVIDARSGNDTLIGGAGDDVLTGGGGSDTYRFNPGRRPGPHLRGREQVRCGRDGAARLRRRHHDRRSRPD